MKKNLVVLIICFCLPLPAWADGIGFKLGQFWLNQKDFLIPYEGPLWYWDFHLGTEGGKIGGGSLIFDLSVANYEGEGKETLFSRDDFVTIYQKEIDKDFLALGDSRASLKVWGVFGHFRYKLPLSFLKIPILSNLSPYAGAGLGYLWKAEYNIETEYTRKNSSGDIVSENFDTDFSGRNLAIQILAGVVLFARSPVSLKLEYQRLQSTLALLALDGNLKKQLPLGGQAVMFEILLNLGREE